MVIARKWPENSEVPGSDCPGQVRVRKTMTAPLFEEREDDRVSQCLCEKAPPHANRTYSGVVSVHRLCQIRFLGDGTAFTRVRLAVGSPQQTSPR